jgi:hypothetical protein
LPIAPGAASSNPRIDLCAYLSYAIRKILEETW